MKLKDIIEYSNDEIGEMLGAIQLLRTYREYYSPELDNTLIRELRWHINWYNENAKIVEEERTEIVKTKWLEIEWTDS